LSVADFSKLSLGFIIDFCIINNKLRKNEDLHREEKNYSKLKGILPIIQKEYENGEINKERYIEFMKKYNGLEERYGFSY
jgi:hypothetical protein